MKRATPPSFKVSFAPLKASLSSFSPLPPPSTSFFREEKFKRFEARREGFSFGKEFEKEQERPFSFAM